MRFLGIPFLNSFLSAVGPGYSAQSLCQNFTDHCSCIMSSFQRNVNISVKKLTPDRWHGCWGRFFGAEHCKKGCVIWKFDLIVNHSKSSIMTNQVSAKPLHDRVIEFVENLFHKKQKGPTMKTKFIKLPGSMLWKPFKQWISKFFRKRDDNDDFFDNPYALI